MSGSQTKAPISRKSQWNLYIVPALLITLTATFAYIFGNQRAAGEQTSRNDPWSHVPTAPPHVDHSTFFQGALADGPSVTQRCLECHNQSGQEVSKGAHFRWEGDPEAVPGHKEPLRIGKKNVINNYCIGVQSNWEACTRCHAGYGWKDAAFDFDAIELIDCLVCHDQSGDYVKGTAGLPVKDVDLQASAKSVGSPTRANCGACHFAGGGGDAVKHGDLDGTMLNPNERIDIHMGGFDMQCISCHRTEHHNIPGRSMSVSVSRKNRVSCTDCHQGQVHEDIRLENHTQTVACQTCHIPSMAIDAPTKMEWDWSTAGDKEMEERIGDTHHYMAIKGSFNYQQGNTPEYAWYNGTSTRYILGDTINPNETTTLAGPLGSVQDPRSQIWPFKVHRGKQIYDTEHKYFIVPKTFGKDGFWTTFDWASAASNGCKATGLECSGNYDFAPTDMYWPLSHMVQKKNKALQCADCHGSSKRLDWLALGYQGDPLTRGGRAQQGLVK